MKRRITTALLAFAAAAGGAVAVAPAASADTFLCYSDWQCAHVTAVSGSGGYLAFHNEPDYVHGMRPGSAHLHNGDVVQLRCWTTGAPDADGHGDRYWFWGQTHGSAVAGFVNDWYLTTGSPASFRARVPKCPPKA